MKFLFLLAFGVGLLIGVYSMLHGVEKNAGTLRVRPKAYFNFPALASFLVLFGAIGYLLGQKTQVQSALTFSLALLAGLLSWTGMTILMAKWALSARHFADNSADEMQGKLAVVVSAQLGTTGKIRYEHNGAEVHAAARSVDGGVLPSGTEVVIDRFEDKVAIVESWTSVERRL